jgi:SMC interacting uncharacterized protein involved in chromosome segregation
MEYQESISLLDEQIEKKEEIIHRLQEKISEIKGELFLLEIEKEDLENEANESRFWEDENRYQVLEYERSVI